MFRPPTKYSEYLQDVRKSIDYILKRVNATTVTKIVAGTNVTISPADGTGVVTINSTGGGGGGLPAGGTAGQILAKIDSVNYNAEWIDNYALWTSTVKHEVKASENINKGQAVYVSTADGTNMIVSKASNTTEMTSSKTMGLLAQNLATNGKGFVVTEGLLSGLNTSGASAGDPVWLGADGNLLFGIANKPYAPLNMVSIGIVTRVNSNNGEIFVKVQNGFELDELHNVDARFPNNNDGIFYNSTTMLWEHKPVSAVYATPTLAQVTTAGNTTTNAITVGGLTVSTDATINGIKFGIGGGNSTFNVAIGLNALVSNTGLGNTAIGYYALNANTTGESIVAIGAQSLKVNTTGGYHVSIGQNALLRNTTGTRNLAIGYQSLFYNTTGIDNIAIGSNAGLVVTTGQNNIYIGNNSNGLSSSENNRTWIGNSGTATTWLGGNVLIGTPTDAGYKLDVNGTGRFQGSANTTPLTISGYSVTGANTTRAIDLTGTWNTSGNVTALNIDVTNTASGIGSNLINASINGSTNIFSVRRDGSVLALNTFAFHASSGNISATASLALSTSFSQQTGIIAQRSQPIVATSGDFFTFSIDPFAANASTNTFIPTSGTATYTAFRVVPTINQTGGANGITRGLYVNPTITAAADFRAIETTAGNIIFNGGNVGIGLTPIYKLDVNGVVRFQSTGTSSVTHSFLFRNDNSSYGGFTIGSSGQALSIQQASGYGYLTAAGFFIGSTNSNIWTNNGSILDIQNAAGTTTYLRVASTTGNVLIGTTTDAGYKLDVNGTGRVKGNVDITTSGGTNVLLAYSSYVQAWQTFYVSQSGGTHNFVVSNASSGGNAYFNNVNVGIGTTSPTYKLEVSSAGYTGFGIMSGANNNAEINFQNTGYSIPRWTIRAIGAPNGSSSSLTFQRLASTFPLTITSGDNVLIGTSIDSGYKLDVNGDIRSTRVYANVIRDTNGNNIVSTSVLNITNTDTTLGTGTTNTLTLSTKSSTGIVYVPNGNVGIGIASPTAKLQIKGTGDSSVWITTEDFNGGTNTGSVIRIGTRSSTGNTAGWIDALNNGYSSYGNLMLSAFGGNVLIGTTTDAGYKLDVNGQFRATGETVLASASGNVGIGTVSPTSKLHINGADPFLRVNNVGSANTHGIKISYNSSDTQGFHLLYNPALAGAYLDNTYLVTSGQPYGDIYFRQNVSGTMTTRMTIKAETGNIGIGTTTPTDIFHIVNNTNGNKFGRISAGGSDASAAWVAQNDQVDNVVYRVFGSGVSGTQMGIALARSASLMANLGGSGKFLLGTYSNTDFVMGTGNAEKMRIVDSTGNVLIGTTTDAGNKLEVSGTASASDFKASGLAGWSGNINIPTFPPIVITVTGGIITNVM